MLHDAHIKAEQNLVTAVLLRTWKVLPSVTLGAKM